MSVFSQKGIEANLSFTDQITVRVGKHPKHIIRCDEGFTEVWETSRQAEKLDVSLSQFLHWSAEFAFKVYSLATACLCQKCFYFKGKRIEGNDVFQVLLLVDPELEKNDLDGLARYKSNLVIAAGVTHVEVAEDCAGRIAQRLKDLGFKAPRSTSLVKQIQEVQSNYSKPLARQDDRLVSAVLGETPAAEDAVLPANYIVTQDGIAVPGDDDFISTVVLITKRFKDVSTGLEQLEIAWLRDGKWLKAIVSRKIVADSRAILDLADRGLPVNSINATSLVGYIADFEAANKHDCELHPVTSKLGYHSTKEGEVFVLPDRSISSHDAHIDFVCSDDGEIQAASGFKSAGTLQEYKAAIELIAEYPKVLLSFVASLTPALATFAKFPNLLIDFSGQTSGGKTTTLRVGAAAWGDPDERHDGSIMKTWKSTQAYVERSAGMCCDLPNFIDDSKNAGNPEDVANLIYMLAQGRGKNRAKVRGLQPTVHFRTIGQSSGERPLTSFTNDAGAKARTLCLWGSPFGEHNVSTGEIASQVNDLVCDNYGTAGPRFVEFILENESEWPSWLQEFENEKTKYIAWAKAEGNDYAARMAPTLAAMSTAFWLACQCFEFTFDYFDIFEVIWSEIADGTGEADQSREALRHVYEVASSNRDKFYGQEKHSTYRGEAWGRWDEAATVPEPDEQDNVQGPVKGTWPYIAFTRYQMNSILEEAGYEPAAVVRTWFDKGWLLTNPNRRTLKVRTGTADGVPMTAIKREAINEAYQD